jgi:glyoxylase-like metal-dependent hydrolase (beta-lactamase superfamily II)
MTTQDYYALKVGDFDLLLFRDGGGPRTASGFLPDAPQDELESIVRGLGEDPDALDFSLKPILVTAGDQRILIDTGLGGTMSNLPMYLSANGVSPEEIDLIVITHGHGDHINGILDAEGNFVFPNANYVIWGGEWEHWTAEGRFEPTDESPSKRVWDALRTHSERVRLLDEENAEIVPGMTAVLTPGHTVGHIAVEVESNGEKLLHIADAAHHYFQLACPQWSPKFDYDPAQAAETRRYLFERAAAEGLLFSAYHFTFPGVGHIVERDGALVWQPREN